MTRLSETPVMMKEKEQRDSEQEQEQEQEQGHSCLGFCRVEHLFECESHKCKSFNPPHAKKTNTYFGQHVLPRGAS